MEVKKDVEIKVISDEESLKILGELLSNQTSRDIMKFLMNKSAYKKKISDELNVSYSLIEHHLKKMEKLGLVKITNRKLIKKGVPHKTYKITADGIFLMLNTTEEEVEKSGVLKRIFREGIKFASIGIASIGSWFITTNFQEKLEDTDLSNMTEWSGNNSFSDPITVPLIILVCGMFLIWFFEKYKKRKG